MKKTVLSACSVFSVASFIVSLALFLVPFNTTKASVIVRPTFEPDNGQAYFGFTFRNWDSTDPAYGDTRVFSDRLQDSITTELSGKAPSIYAVPTIWQNDAGQPVPFSDIQWQIDENAAFNTATSAPVISWNAQTGWDNTSAGYSGITTKTINSGSLDSYIHSYALEVKAYGKPVFIRLICGEVNGNWWKSCSPNANATLTKADFISAWQRVVDIFRAEGVTNVSWVWNLNTFPPAPNNWGIDNDIVSYYPGDNYVDWAGADHYDYGATNATSTNPNNIAQYVDPHYNFAIKHAKPFFLAEWGVRHPSSVLTPSAQQNWLVLMANYISAHPKIKASMYFNYDMNGPANIGPAQLATHTWLYSNQVNYAPSVNDSDHRLVAESGANFRGTFASTTSNALYISQIISNSTPLPDTVAPDVSIASPVNNANATGTISIFTNTYDAYGVTKVDFYVDGVFQSTSTTTPFKTTWNTTGLVHNSNHTIFAKAYDLAGNVATSSSITVKVLDVTKPTVSITSPANNSSVTKRTNVTIAANASDISGVSKVEFYVNSSLKCTDTSSPYSCVWAVPQGAGIQYILEARAYDVAQNMASTSVKVTSN